MINRPYHYDMPKVAAGLTGFVIQKDCLARLAAEFPLCRAFAIPNGSFLASKAARGKAKAEGLSTGFPDLGILGPRMRTAFVEIKGHNDSLKDEQDEWLTWMSQNTHPCAVIRSQDTFADFLIRCGFPSRRFRG